MQVMPSHGCTEAVPLATIIRIRWQQLCALGYRPRMVGVVAALWGLFGGFAVEGLELYAALRRDGRWPWKQPAHSRAGEIPEAGPKGYVIAEAIRLIIGAGLAWAAAATGQIAGPLGALGVGVAAPTIIGQLAKAIPLAVAPELQDNFDTRVPISVSPSRKRDEPRFSALDADGAAEAVELCAQTRFLDKSSRCYRAGRQHSSPL